MNYRQTIDYLFAQLPMFQNIGAKAYNGKLNNTLAICKRLGNPEKKFKSVHIAGTNGKGSTAHYLASVLQSAGYKTGLFTSPHLKDFRERIKVNGQLISEQAVVDYVAENKEFFESESLSFFEMTVALAFKHFADERVDIAIIETGLGGRLDSTNVIQPLCSVITNISFDHMAFLGNTLTQIAGEKAGIIKENTPVVIGETQAEVKEVFVDAANQKSASIAFADKIWKAIEVKNEEKEKLYSTFEAKKAGSEKKLFLESELLGSYQSKNIPTVLSTIDILTSYAFTISEEAIQQGIKKVVTQTRLLGRWQILNTNPLIVADTGHNVAGITEVVKQLNNTPHKSLHFVLGMVNDKDISAVLALLPKNALYYFCRSSVKRALSAEELSEKAKNYGLKGNAYPTAEEALYAAKNNAKADDMVFVGGSTFTVADVL